MEEGRRLGGGMTKAWLAPTAAAANTPSLSRQRTAIFAAALLPVSCGLVSTLGGVVVEAVAIAERPTGCYVRYWSSNPGRLPCLDLRVESIHHRSGGIGGRQAPYERKKEYTS